MPDVVNGDDKSGSTAVCTLISPTHFYIANCGDSRGVLCRQGSPAVSTFDHKPTVPAEKKRIQDAGGSVMIQRVNGSLAVSRALGDFEYKSVEGRGNLVDGYLFSVMYKCFLQALPSSSYPLLPKSSLNSGSQKRINSSFSLAMASGTSCRMMIFASSFRTSLPLRTI